MDKRLLKAAREGDVEAFGRLIGYVEAQEQGAGTTSSHDERAIGITIPPESEAIAGTDAAPGMNSIPRHMLLQGASSDGDGVLHIAASHGHVDLTRAVFDSLGVPFPCHRAASTVASLPKPSSAVRFSKFLRARNNKGETCLLEAVRCGHTELVELLVLADAILDEDKGALVQIADDEGVSPLYLASTLRRDDIVGVLTDKQRCRYSPSYSGPGGKTALHAAVLLNKGALLVHVYLQAVAS